MNHRDTENTENTWKSEQFAFLGDLRVSVVSRI
jgi:hypothetical protein